MLNESLLDPWFLGSVALAVACGGAIGLERQLRGKPAGVRTSVLICFGTTTFVRLGAGLEGSAADPSRVLGQVIVGVGFLGAGVIMNRDNAVKGMTSASVIWMLAAIGAAIGLRQPISAVLLTAVTLGVLVGMEKLENLFAALRRGEHARRETEPRPPDQR